MAQRCVPAPFLTKTYQLVEEGRVDDIISWGEDGTSFVVWKPTEFARDLLPNYFKHNNFSSFVRQLNTYGFRKVVPDRWEFANDFFRRGHKDLLCEIHRRKSTAQIATGKSNGHPSSTSNSNNNHHNDDQGSSSTSSLEPTQAQLADLSDENEKLRKDNEQLSSELARTKKQYKELLTFLSKYVDEDTIKCLMTHEESILREGEGEAEAKGEQGEEEEEAEEERLKLFGVWLSGKKRGCPEGGLLGGGIGPKKELRMGLNEPWLKICSSPRGSSKVCN